MRERSLEYYDGVMIRAVLLFFLVPISSRRTQQVEQGGGGGRSRYIN